MRFAPHERALSANVVSVSELVVVQTTRRIAYFEAYSHFDELVHKQDRALLDTLLPLELTRDIASHYQKTNV